MARQTRFRKNMPVDVTRNATVEIDFAIPFWKYRFVTLPHFRNQDRVRFSFRLGEAVLLDLLQGRFQRRSVLQPLFFFLTSAVLTASTSSLPMIMSWLTLWLCERISFHRKRSQVYRFVHLQWESCLMKQMFCGKSFIHSGLPTYYSLTEFVGTDFS